jgi:hypothetical protein
VLAGVGGLDCRIERQQVGLQRDHSSGFLDGGTPDERAPDSEPECEFALAAEEMRASASATR